MLILNPPPKCLHLTPISHSTITTDHLVSVTCQLPLMNPGKQNQSSSPLMPDTYLC